MPKKTVKVVEHERIAGVEFAPPRGAVNVQFDSDNQLMCVVPLNLNPPAVGDSIEIEFDFEEVMGGKAPVRLRQLVPVKKV